MPHGRRLVDPGESEVHVEYRRALSGLLGGEALGDSYKRIFANYLVELYMAQRKYKDALTIKSEYGYV